MSKKKRLEELSRKIQRIESSWLAHNDAVGHPELCGEATIVVRTWDCLLGSPESAMNTRVDPPANLTPAQVLTALRRAVKWQEYDVMLRERAQLLAELGNEERVNGNSE